MGPRSGSAASGQNRVPEWRLEPEAEGAGGPVRGGRGPAHEEDLGRVVGTQFVFHRLDHIFVADPGAGVDAGQGE